jgi:cyclopropane-fatty-acyl-phospholipid synthase
MQLAEVFEPLLRDVPEVGLRAYDGSAIDRPDARATLDIRSPRALSYLVTAPGELGLARAYVSGELAVTGDLYTALSSLADGNVVKIGYRPLLEIVRKLGPSGLRRPPRPPEEIGQAYGRSRRRQRDAAAISHHYDISNDLYEIVLGPSMTYTCALFPEEDTTLDEAQAAKHDLVCRKLGLREGMTLLDVGCGWGGMVMHAARHYGVRALGVTLSRQQVIWAQKAIAAAGLADQAEVQHLDYRDVPPGQYDAISSIGLTEHVGARNLGSYFRLLHSRLKTGGRLLNHSIVRPTTDQRHRAGPLMSRYVFPNGELEGVGEIISVMQDTGFEIRHSENLREHYARTLTCWNDNLQDHWSEAVELVGEGSARVWLLYMTGSRVGFERHAIELQQVLGVKVEPNGQAHMPRRSFW